MVYLYDACDQISDFCHQQLLRKMRRKISWTDGGNTVYPPPPLGSGGIINVMLIYICISATNIQFIKEWGGSLYKSQLWFVTRVTLLVSNPQPIKKTWWIEIAPKMFRLQGNTPIPLSFVLVGFGLLDLQFSVQCFVNHCQFLLSFIF